MSTVSSACVRTIRRVSSLCALSLALVAGTASAESASPCSVGEVSSNVGHEDVVVPTIKSALVNELSKVQVPSGKRYIVSASLVKLETKTTEKDATTSAVVSLAIRDAKDGALRGFINGNSAVISKPGDPKAEKLVLESAVRGATKNIQAVLSKS